MRLKKGVLLASLVALALASFGSAEEVARHPRWKGAGTLPAGRPKANAALAPKTWGVGTSYLRVGAGEFILTDSAPYSNTMFTTSGTTSRVYGLTTGAFAQMRPIPIAARMRRTHVVIDASRQLVARGLLSELYHQVLCIVEYKVRTVPSATV